MRLASFSTAQGKLPSLLWIHPKYPSSGCQNGRSKPYWFFFLILKLLSIMPFDFSLQQTNKPNCIPWSHGMFRHSSSKWPDIWPEKWAWYHKRLILRTLSRIIFISRPNSHVLYLVACYFFLSTEIEMFQRVSFLFILISYMGLHVKYSLFLSGFKEPWFFLERFSKNSEISFFMKTFLVRAELFHADGQTVCRCYLQNSRMTGVSTSFSPFPTY